MRKLVIAITFLGFLGCERHEKECEEIFKLEDRRVAAVRFSDYTMHSSSHVQEHAAIALGRLQDPHAVPMLAELLTSSKASVRVEAAFALGQLAQANTHQLLLDNLAEEKDLEAQLYLIEALSKVADKKTLDQIDYALTQKLKDEIPIVRAEAALAIGRLAYRKFKRSHWPLELSALLDDSNEEVRWRSAYALMRLADSSAAPVLIKALDDRSARVRMQAARALGIIADPSAIAKLISLAGKDSDWRVRVNATTALGQIIQPVSSESLLDQFPLTDPSLHVRLTAIRAAGAAYTRIKKNDPSFEVMPALNFLLKKMHDGSTNGSERQPAWQERTAAAYSFAQILGGEAIEQIAPLTQNSNHRLRAGAARALGATQDRRAFESLEKLSYDDSTLVKISALEALPRISAPKRSAPIYVKALESADQVLTAIAARNLAADSSNREQHALAIIDGYHKLRPPLDVESAQMIFAALADCGNPKALPLLEEALGVQDKPFARAAANALEKLTGSDYSEYLPKETRPHRDFTFEEIDRLKGAWASIETDAGEFELQFFVDEAPLVALNFARLAREKFFDGLEIHRVVPNFVVQAGDPRGDMWGSPGYAIRSQFSRLRYVRGMVGMASVGPDTEGCQWFITHSDQPHLDGRYSIFARVRKGMEVVDKLQVGDRIRRITIHH